MAGSSDINIAHLRPQTVPGAPTIAGRYFPERVVDEWGPVTIYAGVHQALGTTCTIAMLAGDASPFVLQQFAEDARRASLVVHPHVVPVFDFGIDDASQRCFLAASALPPESLATQRQLPWRDVAILMQQCAQALRALHRAGFESVGLHPGMIRIARTSSGDVECRLYGVGFVQLAQPSRRLDAAIDVQLLGAAFIDRLSDDAPLELADLCDECLEATSREALAKIESTLTHLLAQKPTAPKPARPATLPDFSGAFETDDVLSLSGKRSSAELVPPLVAARPLPALQRPLTDPTGRPTPPAGTPALPVQLSGSRPPSSPVPPRPRATTMPPPVPHRLAHGTVSQPTIDLDIDLSQPTIDLDGSLLEAAKRPTSSHVYPVVGSRFATQGKAPAGPKWLGIAAVVIVLAVVGLGYWWTTRSSTAASNQAPVNTPAR